MDFSFMKSGFDPTADVEDMEEFKKNVSSLIVAFGENAMRTGAKYVSHSKRNVITVEDLKRAMMLEMFLFSNRPGIIEKAKKIKEEIYNEDEDEDEDEDVSDFISNKKTKFELNTCDCALCTCINTIPSKWERWTPTTPYEKMLKKHIDSINV